MDAIGTVHEIDEEARNFEADLDFAFQLQMQEALVASLALQQQQQQQHPHQLPDSPELEPINIHKITEDTKRRIHDHKFAREIIEIPEDEWTEFGDDIERPFIVGSSSSCSSSSSSSSNAINNQETYRLYFKGLHNVPTCGIGVAVCDSRDNLVLKIQKPLSGDLINHREVELKGLIEGLNAALSLGIKRISFYCVNRTIFNQITGRWQVKQRRIGTLINQVFHLQRKFETCHPLLVAGNDLKFAFKLARDAIDSRLTKPTVSSSSKTLHETCSICLEESDTTQMFVVDGCLHRYCFPCMKQHMEVKILQGLIPGCPHEGCKTTLTLDGSKKVLPPKLVATMSNLIKEASVPVTQKLYCPYPKCSTLMSKTEALEYANKFMAADRSVVRKCVKCHGLFCIECKVPWHSNMSCPEFKMSNITARVEEAKLKTLANQNLWRQCVKCNHMIELAEGCFHMTCRCGYEFCYTCGAEWKDKKQTCSCELWDERYINRDYDDDDDEDFFDEEDDDDFEHDFDDNDFEQDFVLDRGWYPHHL